MADGGEMNGTYEPTDTDLILDQIQEEGNFNEEGGVLGQGDFEDALTQ